MILVDGKWTSPSPPPPPEEGGSTHGLNLRHVQVARRIPGPVGATARGERPCRRPGSGPPPAEGPTVEVSDEHVQRVFEYAKANGLTLREATDHLIEYGWRRLAALRRYGQGKGAVRQRKLRARLRAERAGLR